MAHEVIKKVGRRAYRYRVESYRDPETKKVRSRWRYLGVAAPGDSASPPPAVGGAAPHVRKRSAATNETRERLVRAFLELVESGSYSAVTAGMVAAKAGLAHGTFYRYFRDKRAVFMAALDRVREELERDRPTFDPPFGDVRAERARVRAWTTTLLTKPALHAGMLRAFYDALEGDPELQALRRERRAARMSALARYLQQLDDAGIVEIDDPVALAAALTVLVDAALRESVIAGAVPERATLSGVVYVFERSIF